MTEPSKKIVLPAYLIRRLEAFRIAKGSEHSYVVRDKLYGKTYDFDPWQFFILEVLPGCESLEKLQTVFNDRFDRTITAQELDTLFASIADQKLFDEAALQHPLLEPFARRTFEVVDGKAVHKSFSAAVGQVAGAAAPAPAVPSDDGMPPADGEPLLPPGVEEAVGLDARAATKMLDLFDPRPLLRTLSPVVAPLRYLVYVLPVVLLVAIVLVARNWQLLATDLGELHSRLSLFGRIVFVLFTVNVLATINLAFVAHAFRVTVNRIGITLLLGFIPRFTTHMLGVAQLNRRETMWLHGSNLVLRLFLFSFGVLLWYNTRDHQGTLPELGLMFVLTVGASLLLEAGNPLAKGSAYFLLSAYLNERHLRGKSYKALMNKLRGGAYQSTDSNVLALYSLATITYLVGLILFLGIGLLEWLNGHLDLGGTALLIAGAFVGYLLWRNYVGLKKFGDTYERMKQFDRWRKRTLVAEDMSEGEVAKPRPGYWRRALLVCPLLLLFVPYPYDVSGSFSIYPLRRQVLSTDTPGLIETVYFDGGETVKKGTVIARLAGDEYSGQIKVLDAQIQQQMAVISDLQARPKPEEVRVAQQALSAARTSARFSREKVPRVDKLYAAGAMSFEELDAARKQRDTDAMEVGERLADLELVKAGPTADQIAAEQAKLSSLQQERNLYVDKLERTVIRMPFDGNILTLHLKDRTNSYLDKGQPLATIEYIGKVTAEIAVPESDVQYVEPGATVRVRPVAYFNQQFDGTVTLLDRNVTTESFGSTVKVLATIDNHDGKLNTGMTGVAKIRGETMPAWKAFSQAIIRFVKVQVWSWIP
jgi:putative peptide zinc metalloprotease protein